MTDYTHIEIDTFRIIPSRFPPIALFEDLLDPNDLDLAYELESLTNDRIRDEVGDISLVPPQDRVSGYGSSPIMAAFTHVIGDSRFSDGRYGVYYAANSKATALTESAHARQRFMRATNEPPNVLHMRCYRCLLNSQLVDARQQHQLHNPNDWSPAQTFGRQQKQAGANGIIYRSVRHKGGECYAVFRPNALQPPATQAGHFQYRWDGERITHTFEMVEVL